MKTKNPSPSPFVITFFGHPYWEKAKDPPPFYCNQKDSSREGGRRRNYF